MDRWIERVLLVVIATILTLVPALRWRIGTDYVQYERNFVGRYRYSGIVSSEDEPGWLSMVHLARWIADDPASMFFMASVFTIVPIVVALHKYSPDFTLSLFLFIAGGAWLGSTNAVRQYLAAAILLFGYSFLRDRKIVGWFAVVLVAASFHFSAIVCILLILVPRRRVSDPVALAVVLGGALASVGSDVILTSLDGFSPDEISDSSYAQREINPLRVAFAFVPYLAYRFMAMRRPDPVSNLHANLMLLHGTLFLVSWSSAYLARVTIYTSIFLALSVPYILKAIRPGVRPVVYLLLVVTYAIFGFLETWGNSSLDPYVSLIGHL